MQLKLFLSVLSIVLSLESNAQPKIHFPYQSQNGKWTFIVKNEEDTNQVWYDSIVVFDRYINMVQLNGKWNAVDKTGKYLLPSFYDSISRMNHYFIVGSKDENENFKLGLYHREGHVILPVQYENIDLIRSHTALFYPPICIVADLSDSHTENVQGVYDLEGKPILPHAYQQIIEIPRHKHYEGSNSANIFVTQVHKNDTVYVGGYNLKLNRWIFPCNYWLRNFGTIYSDQVFLEGYYPFQNKTNFYPLSTEEVLVIPTSIGFLNYNFDYYTHSGRFLGSSKTFEKPANWKTLYYVLGDSIIGKTKQAGIQIITDSLNRVLLNFGGSMALYDFEKGFLIDSGTYLFPSSPLDQKEIDKGYFSVKKRTTHNYEYLSFDGSPFNRISDTSIRYLNSKLIIRDSNGVVKDMRPYKIKYNIHDTGYYVAKKDDKWGIITGAKEEKLPFRFDYIYRKSGDDIFRADKGKTSTLYDLNFEKLMVTRNLKWLEVDYAPTDKYVILKGKKNYGVYDIDNQTYLLEKVKSPSEETIDSVLVFGGSSLVRYHNLSDSTGIIQYFSANHGWSFYDLNTKKTVTSPHYSIHPMRPIVINNSFLGFIYISKDTPYAYAYHFFNGMRFDGLDHLKSIHFNPELNCFFVADTKYWHHYFSPEGDLIGKFEDSHSTREHIIVKKGDQYNLVNRNGNELLENDFDKLKTYAGYISGTRKEGEYIILRGEKIQVLGPFETIEQLNKNLFIVKHHEGQRDFCVLENDHFYTRFKDVSLVKNLHKFYAIQTGNTIFWVTQEGELSGQQTLPEPPSENQTLR